METVEVLMSTLELKNEKEYIEMIKKAYKENPEAEGIFFYVENINTKREENKRIKHKKTQFLDVMKLRIYELSLKKETIETIKENFTIWKATKIMIKGSKEIKSEL